MCKVTLLFFALFTILSCKNSSVEIVDYSQEVSQLSSLKEQSEFLEKIGVFDQKVRRDETEALQKFGHNSKEHQESLISMMEADNQNLAKIEAYLNVYGHPTIEGHGKDAARTPWMVIHHATGGVEPRTRNFKYLYEAWKNEDIRGVEFTFYLNRMYDIKFGKRLELKNPYREEFEIDTLIRSLELETVEKKAGD
ncbi:MAG: hypothetical protein GY705_17590 [Bacteroidetes bacterium]|nr:hypothetical protein [Bacteroidota bacterium]